MLFLSLGAGVQSSVMLMLAIRGEIELPDHVIFADTGFEPRAVYRHLKWCKRQCDKAGIPLHVVSAKRNMREGFEAFEKGEIKHWDERPPFYVINHKMENSRGTLIRQCTRDAKVKPIERKQISLMGHKTARTVVDGEAIIQIGISTDEARRAHPSRVRWIERDYPLIDPLKFSRNDCQSWWEKNHPYVNLPSSSCVICPYKTSKMWLQMKESAPADWQEAVDYDVRIRSSYESRTQQSTFVHRDFVPLSDANLNETQFGFDLEDEIYCAGGCGL